MLTTQRTRIKICGFTRRTDIDCALALGVDALGLVFYPNSPRYVDPTHAADLLKHLPPFVTVVGLFVNPTRTEVQRVLDQVPLGLLQFHGDESDADCAAYPVPFIKVARVHANLNLVEFASNYPHAQALLLDTLVEHYGGSGQSFDWSLIPDTLATQCILSGGLNAENVGRAIAQIHPYAVDVSSGVELSKGIKDANKMRHFVAAVNMADCS